MLLELELSLSSDELNQTVSLSFAGEGINCSGWFASDWSMYNVPHLERGIWDGHGWLYSTNPARFLTGQILVGSHATIYAIICSMDECRTGMVLLANVSIDLLRNCSLGCVSAMGYKPNVMVGSYSRCDWKTATAGLLRCSLVCGCHDTSKRYTSYRLDFGARWHDVELARREMDARCLESTGCTTMLDQSGHHRTIGNNVGQNAFRIFQIQRAFLDAHQALVASLEWDIHSSHDLSDGGGEYPLLNCLLQSEDARLLWASRWCQIKCFGMFKMSIHDNLVLSTLYLCLTFIVATLWKLLWPCPVWEAYEV